MNTMENYTNALNQAATATFNHFIVHLPNLLGALALLLLGWLLARVLRALTRRGAALLDSLIARTIGAARWQIGHSAAVLGTIVYWVVLLFFVTAATQTLGLQTFTDWLSRLLEYLPTLAAGLLIVAAGYVLSGFVAELVRATATGLASSAARCAGAGGARRDAGHGLAGGRGPDRPQGYLDCRAGSGARGVADWWRHPGH